ncbi:MULTISPECIES: transposase [unclassified Microcoleus]|uniref:RNA-guided endonuclease InsQ/TnpB family protein n=1 Tax=unclassified Microcoleus TaxID=2642155 RepID=UPI001DA8AED3|nr:MULTISPECIES: transposase [unclassified Microcoleus]TAE35777.1 MAG: transposase [Oscillatoriales cyanobacterium]MCC3414509.1 transposase [Microcoleus sp. PH2017_02_FOX_O_A]MCC3474748.1 transposase [Microcoleus sp. PH2017_13_LAR_U_A]MCC3487258.1 transposase [Microcoleus sp. PH2017_14_LAR_D_A]MCC3494194.1 transposase [Microcoleus sp. PH2017_16_JOR_D_A]
MQLAERHIIKSTEPRFAQIDELAFKSKNLYNAANYVIRQNFIYGWGYVSYNEMNRLMKSHQAYKALPAKVSQQILMVLDKNWKSFFEAVKAYKADSSKFTGRPKLPNYKDKTKGRNLLVYTIQAISSKQLKKGIVKLSGTELLIKTKVDPDRICQVRLVPKCDSYVIEVIYDEPESTAKDNDFAAGVDLGLNNLVALTSNQPGFIPLLINGRTLKSINQFYNKRSSRLQSQLKGRRKTSPRIQRLTRCRNQKVDNYLHHTSRTIVDILVAQRIGTLVIGKNAQWKTDINLGKQTNQNFVSIPHARLIEMLEYKGFLVGIKVIVQEESFTSKANFLGLDPIPVYGKTKTEPVFTGKRIKRGLYKTSTGQLINSDVNASYNILRKAIPNAFSDGIGSCVVQPRRVNPLKVKVKGEGLEASHVYK